MHLPTNVSRRNEMSSLVWWAGVCSSNLALMTANTFPQAIDKAKRHTACANGLRTPKIFVFLVVSPNTSTQSDSTSKKNRPVSCLCQGAPGSSACLGLPRPGRDRGTANLSSTTGGSRQFLHTHQTLALAQKVMPSAIKREEPLWRRKGILGVPIKLTTATSHVGRVNIGHCAFRFHQAPKFGASRIQEPLQIGPLSPFAPAGLPFAGLAVVNGRLCQRVVLAVTRGPARRTGKPTESLTPPPPTLSLVYPVIMLISRLYISH